MTGDFKAAYPNAKLLAPQEAIERHGDPNLKFDGGMSGLEALSRHVMITEANFSSMG